MKNQVIELIEYLEFHIGILRFLFSQGSSLWPKENFDFHEQGYKSLIHAVKSCSYKFPYLLRDVKERFPFECLFHEYRPDLEPFSAGYQWGLSHARQFFRGRHLKSKQHTHMSSNERITTDGDGMNNVNKDFKETIKKPIKSMNIIVENLNRFRKSSRFSFFDKHLSPHFRAIGEYIRESEGVPPIQDLEANSKYNTTSIIRGLSMHIMAAYDMIHQGTWEKATYMSMYDKRLCHTYLYLADAIDKLTPDEFMNIEKKSKITGSKETQLERSVAILKHAIMNFTLFSKELIPHYLSVGNNLAEKIGVIGPPVIDTSNDNLIIDQLRTCEFILTGFSYLNVDIFKGNFSEYFVKMGLYLDLLSDEQLQIFI